MSEVIFLLVLFLYADTITCSLKRSYHLLLVDEASQAKKVSNDLEDQLLVENWLQMVQHTGLYFQCLLTLLVASQIKQIRDQHTAKYISGHTRYNVA